MFKQKVMDFRFKKEKSKLLDEDVMHKIVPETFPRKYCDDEAVMIMMKNWAHAFIPQETPLHLALQVWLPEPR